MKSWIFCDLVPALVSALWRHELSQTGPALAHCQGRHPPPTSHGTGGLRLPSGSPASAGAHPEPIRASFHRSRESRVMGPRPCWELACSFAGGQESGTQQPSPAACMPACTGGAVGASLPCSAIPATVLCFQAVRGVGAARAGVDGKGLHRIRENKHFSLLVSNGFTLENRLGHRGQTHPPLWPAGETEGPCGSPVWPGSRARVSLGPEWCCFSSGISVLCELGEAHGPSHTRFWVMTKPGAQPVSERHDSLTFPAATAERGLSRSGPRLGAVLLATSRSPGSAVRHPLPTPQLLPHFNLY